MDFLKRLFGGGESDGSPNDGGIYLFVKSDSSGEVIRIRLEPRHELVPREGGGYVNHKTIVGTVDYKRIEATFYFDASQRLEKADLQGGSLSNASEWQDNIAPQG